MFRVGGEIFRNTPHIGWPRQLNAESKTEPFRGERALKESWSPLPTAPASSEDPNP